jgi:hypothetical protein
MNPHRRIRLDTFAMIDVDSPMEYEIVVPTEAQVVLGHGTGSFYLTVSEEGLVKLMEFAGAVLKDIRARSALPARTPSQTDDAHCVLRNLPRLPRHMTGTT